MRRYFALWYAARFIGKPYLWGGDDPVGGFDCSGFISEICRAFGIISVHARYSAAGLFDHLMKNKFRLLPGPERGCLVFWRSRQGVVSHVELAISKKYAIGAFGGDSTTDGLEDAMEANAFVGVRPIKRWATGQLHYVRIF